MIHETLKKLGFTDKEVEVYLAILQQGKIAPADIAKLTNINRSTVYDVSKELIARGAITEDLGSSVRYFVARPPKEFAAYAEKDFDQKRALLSRAVEELSQMAKSTRYSVPKIQFYSEDEIESCLFRQTPSWVASMTEDDCFWWGFQDVSFVEHYTQWLTWYWEYYSDKGVRLLSNAYEDKKVAKGGFHHNRSIRFWKDAQDFSATYFVVGDYILMIITKQRPHYMVEIHDSVMAHNVRQIFKGIWKGLSK
jgi:predicted transcriptional regulator